MTALLFALVDSTYLWRFGQLRYWRSARRRLGMRDLVGSVSPELTTAGVNLGWWRSLWPMGGGA